MIGAATGEFAGIWSELDEARGRLTLSHGDLPDTNIGPDVPQDIDRFLTWVRPLYPADRSLPTDIVSADKVSMTDTSHPSISITNGASHRTVKALAALRDGWDHQNFGVYDTVKASGRISVGDTNKVI